MAESPPGVKPELGSRPRRGDELLAGGIAYHVRYMVQLRAERRRLADQQLIHAETTYPYSLSLMTAVVLLLLGGVAMMGVVFGIGPLG